MSSPATPSLQHALMRTVVGLQKHLESCEHAQYTNQPEVTPANLEWMLNEIIAHMDTLPSDKVNRWIGFVQGVRAAQGYLSVKQERDRTRPFFHEAYARAGVAIPETKEREA